MLPFKINCSALDSYRFSFFGWHVIITLKFIRRISWKTMWIFGQSIEKKREKVIRQEAKDFMKQFVEAGMNRQTARNGMEMLSSLVIEGYQQNKVYAKSKTQIAFAMMLIEKLMEEMQKKDTEDVRERLKKLTSVLEEVFHECTVRRDDADFTDTCTYLKRMADMYDNSQCLMLQSELENLRYLLGDYPSLRAFC